MENAINQLLDDLERLAKDIDTLNDNQRGKVYTLLHETLDKLKNMKNLYQEEFLKPLINLTEEVIDINLSGESGFNRKLTIPSYDLFLPFKAITDSKTVEPYPMATYNERIAFIESIAKKVGKTDQEPENIKK